MPDIVVLNLDVKDLDDPRLLSLMDEPLGNWATRYHKDGLRKLLRTARGTNYPIRSWGHLRESEPTLDEIRAEFAAADNADGICAVLDGTPFVVLDLNGSPDHARRLLTDTGIHISDLHPRVITGIGHQHLWCRTDRPIGRHIRLLKSDKASVDVLGSGIVLLPPTVHPDMGEAYHWRPPFFDTAKLPPLPQRLHELIDESQRPTQPRLALVDGPIPEGVVGGRSG